MPDTLATKRIRASNEWGYMVINECDFDPAIHEEYDAEAPMPPTAGKSQRRTPSAKHVLG